ncbi:MAG: hydroxymethylglutaryl-CoA reductase, degradative [Saprospiraceae bacterium]|nr:hydroxymethylglutaryl-CoA reductase, degradative [Saprospiraceae bacterium]
MNKTINGFYKLTKEQKIDWLAQHFYQNTEGRDLGFLQSFQHPDAEFQRIFDGFSENTIANFPMPYGIAPNFLINNKVYAVPMVIEESSVVAAASSGAKYWSERGGFHAEVLGTVKVGQVHFTWSGEGDILRGCFEETKKVLIAESEHITANMTQRGGGILGIELIDFTDQEADYYQLRCTFETCDSMGANFINSVLEQFGQTLEWFLAEKTGIEPVVVMCILSNFTPNCLVRAWVECDIEDFHHEEAAFYAEKFRRAVRIARIDPYRAVTHNKGIMNGIDAVVLATANDFRAIEACAHAFAARDGQYRSLSDCTIENGRFKFWIDMPLALGTVGGLTSLHPLARLSLDILGKPSAAELMQVVAVVGLAQNFAAVRSLVTTGIQKGHMKMHLTNILNHLAATEGEATAAQQYFDNKTVSFTAVRTFLDSVRT